MNAKIAFVHVPRTAGTSFRHQLQQAGLRVFMDYGDDPFVAGRHPQYESVEAVMKFGDFDVIAGHVKASRYATPAEKNGWKLVTWIRDPLERLMSNYTHWVQQFWLRHTFGETHVEFCEERPTFMEWLARPEVVRAMSLQLDVEPERFDFLGHTEGYNLQLPEFNAEFGSEIQVSHENADFLRLKLTNEEIECAQKMLEEAGESEAYRKLSAASPFHCFRKSESL